MTEPSQTATLSPITLVVMGPSGVGKTTTATFLAERLGWPYAEADEFHSAANIAKMEAGEPLNDADRAPWLAAIRDYITERSGHGVSTVVTCSALKRRYRDVLREARNGRVVCVMLQGDPEIVAERMEHRVGHFMPKSLLTSQYATLEPLEADEDGLTVTVDRPPEAVVSAIIDRLGLEPVNETSP